jgi:hypothetical protein
MTMMLTNDFFIHSFLSISLHYFSLFIAFASTEQEGYVDDLYYITLKNNSLHFDSPLNSKCNIPLFLLSCFSKITTEFLN